MPLYEYKCRKCGEQFEKLVRASDTDKPVTCPYCGEEDTERKVSVFGSLFGCGSSSGFSGGG